MSSTGRFGIRALWACLVLFTPVLAAAQGPLSNGGIHEAAISAPGESDVWTFNASAGDSILLGVGEVGADTRFAPYIRLQNPSGVVIGSSIGALAGAIDVTAPVSGSYTVLISSGDSGALGVGQYRLTLAKVPGTFVVSAGDEGGALTNGDNHAGTIYVGDLDVWTFSANKDDYLALSVGKVPAGAGDAGFAPYIRLFGPNGALLGSSIGALVGQISVAAPLTGSYTLVVSSGDSGNDGFGTYNLTLAKAPGTFVQPAGDPHGPLTNGAIHTGSIFVGDLDMWSFTAAKDDYLALSIGELPYGEIDPGFAPYIRLIGPDGALLGSGVGNWVGQININAPLSGSYTVVVSSGDSGADGTGDYRLTLVKAPGVLTVSPGDQGGALTSGANYNGRIVTGDLDAWTIAANKDDYLVISIAEPPFGEVDPGFAPWIRLIGPNGVLLGSSVGNWTGQIALTAPLTGTYTVIAATGDSGADAEGNYRLTFARPPAPFVINSEPDGSTYPEPTDNDGGALGNGATHEGSIRMGDLDQWSITASAGDSLLIGFGEKPFGEVDPGFAPWIRLFDPKGVLVGSSVGNWVGLIDVTATLSGTYTAVVGTGDSGQDGVGTYRITAVKAPGAIVTSAGDTGGAIVPDNTPVAGDIYRGDLDPWTFSAPAGATITARITEPPFGEVDPGFNPWILLFGPNGTLVASSSGATTAQISVTAPLSGVYTIVALSGDSGNDAEGHYELAVQVVPVRYSVTAIAGANGTISPAGTQIVDGGTQLVFTLTPAAGFEVSTVSGCSGTRAGLQYTTAPIAAACSVVATFSTAPPRTVTPSAGAGGTISPSTPQTVTNGQTRTFTLTPAAGYVIAGVGGTCGGSLAGNVFTTAAVTANCTVVATFRSLPILSLNPTTLQYAAVSNGAAFTSQTQEQVVQLTQSGAGVVTWTATPSQPWLHVSPAAGTGPATLTVTISFVPGLPVPSTLAGSIAFTVTGAPNTPGPIAVGLTTRTSGAEPIGLIDTPADNRTGVTGAVPFTGWAVDETGLVSVAICRAPVAGEAAPPNGDCGGANEIGIGFAVMIDGARPDVAAGYPTYPGSTRAGWGFMVLTNMLPNQGNGTYVFHAWARDADGHSTLLGARTMTCANAQATLPFGTIDTPAQGGLVSGSSYVNFGWALTPQPKTIPTDGSTMSVFVDGQPQGRVTYNNYRPDIASLFPGLNNSNAAIGFRVLDTTAFTNGLHTIAWVVTDNQGAIEGLGSRFFTVANSPAATPAASTPAPPPTTDTAAILALPLATDPVASRQGWDLAAPFAALTPDGSGPLIVRAEEVDRVELTVGAAAGRRLAGYLRTGDTLAPLPIGSSLDAATGVFTWAPGAGFVGAYDFVFLTLEDATPVARHEVRILIEPKGRGAVGPQVVIDTPTKQQDVGQPFLLAGWAADLDAAAGTGISTVHVWAYPLTGDAPIFLGVADHARRPDVAAVYGPQFATAGYGLIVDGLTPGNYDLAVFAASVATGDFLPATVVRVTVR